MKEDNNNDDDNKFEFKLQQKKPQYEHNSDESEESFESKESLA